MKKFLSLLLLLFFAFSLFSLPVAASVRDMGPTYDYSYEVASSAKKGRTYGVWEHYNFHHNQTGQIQKGQESVVVTDEENRYIKIEIPTYIANLVLGIDTSKKTTRKNTISYTIQPGKCIEVSDRKVYDIYSYTLIPIRTNQRTGKVERLTSDKKIVEVQKFVGVETRLTERCA